MSQPAPMSATEHEIMEKACKALRENAPGVAFMVILAFDRDEEHTNLCIGSNVNSRAHPTLLSMALEGYERPSADTLAH